MEQKFSVAKRAKSFTHAGRGVFIFLKSTHNAWLHMVILGVVVAAGVYVRLTSVEWLFVILAAGLVLTAEAFNTAIEIDMDLTSPEEHPRARDTKDVAAGAVLISALTAGIVGILIFGHHIVAL